MSGPLLFFDGECNLCNAAVQFIIRHDKRGRVSFAPLQSEKGKAALAAVLSKYGTVPDSLILQEGTTYLSGSDAALRAASYLDGGWKAFAWLRIFPAFLRNAVYRLVARNRYRWFGRREACMIPTPELRRRFAE